MNKPVAGRNRPFSIFSRRGFLTGLGATVLRAATAGASASGVATAQRLTGNLFSLGVASGDPLPDGVVLWTRLAPEPLTPTGGMPSRSVAVEWQVATDERMENVVQLGAALAAPELGHSVHVEVSGLEPSRWYWYRFKAGTTVSQVGRTKTAPAAGAPLDQLRFAFASCQNYTQGYYSAYDQMSREDLDLVVFLGDYIYESGATGVRAHVPAYEIQSIADYRIRYAQYKSDPALQAAHANFPWIMTWDDHEVENDYAGFLPEDPADNTTFEARRARAYQVYYENMPLRRAQIPTGPYLQLYRRLAYGGLADFHVLDTRQYRSARQPANCADSERVSGYCPEAFDPARTIAGVAQRDWLIDGLARSTANWNVVANQVLFAPYDSERSNIALRISGGEQWDGYPLDRQPILDSLRERGQTNAVVITGDIHVNFVRNVPASFADLGGTPVATEFVGTSISSTGLPEGITQRGNPDNPLELYASSNHGYVRCTLTPNLYQADYRLLPTVLQPGGAASTVASFVVEPGRAGAVEV